MSKLLRALVGAILAIGFTMTATGTAGADTKHQLDCGHKDYDEQVCSIWWTNNDVRAVSEVRFSADGEHLVLRDYWADGRGLFVRISWGRTYDDVYNTFGARKDVRKNYDIPDGTRVYIKACQSNNGNYDINCVNTWTEA